MQGPLDGCLGIQVQATRRNSLEIPDAVTELRSSSRCLVENACLTRTKQERDQCVSIIWVKCRNEAIMKSINGSSRVSGCVSTHDGPLGVLFSSLHELGHYDDVAFGAGNCETSRRNFGDKVRTRKSPAIVGPGEHHDRPARLGG